MDGDKFQKRRTKALKKKETYEKNGQYSNKHLRIYEELRNKKKHNIHDVVN